MKKKNYLIKKFDNDQKLFANCLQLIKKEKYLMISGGKTFFPLHKLANNLKNKKKIYISLSDERIVNQKKNTKSNFYNLSRNVSKNQFLKIIGFKKNLNKTKNKEILNFYEKTIPLKKIKKIFLSPGVDGHFASIFKTSSVLASSNNFDIIKKETKYNRLTLKFDYFTKKKLYVVLNKKKRKILNMIKKNEVKYPIVNLIQKSKKKVSIIYV